MALRSTVYRADLTLSDLDRHVYLQRALTLARHPSETEERLMVRLLAFALFASDALEFGRGLSAEGEPDLWARDPTGVIDLWIEVGLPAERDLRKACGRARQVAVIAYGARRLDAWWAENAAALARLANLTVLALDGAQSEALAALAARAMTLAVTVQDGHLWIAAGDRSIDLAPDLRQRAA